MNILNFLFSNPLSWGFASALFFILAYSWTTKVDDIDDVMASHINLLQTEKLDRDGAIPMTGNLTTPGIIPTGLTTGYIPYKPAGALANSPIYTDGTKVGIGTTGPGSQLTVSGDGAGGADVGALRLVNTNADGSSWRLQSLQPGISGGDFVLYDVTNSVARIVVQGGVNHNTGNVGIGTTSPTAGFRLDVQAAAAGQLIKSTTGTNYVYLTFQNCASSDFVIGREQSTGGGILGGSSAYAAFIAAFGTYPLQFGVNNVVAMTILNGGNVGIGTVSPEAGGLVSIDGDRTGTYAQDTGQLILRGGTDSAKRLGFMIDTTNNVSKIQSFKAGTGAYDLALQPAGGNVSIGTTAVGASAAKVLTLGDGTAPGALANTASIVSLSGELYGVDAAGNQTLNSPHKNEILDKSDPLIPYPWCYHARNPYLGKEVLLDWSVVIAEVERLSGKKFVVYRDILSEEKRDWVADQDKNISAERERRIREKMNEEVEIETAEAFEDLPITMKVDSGKEEFRYASEDGKIIKKATPIMIDQPTGETKKQLKNGIRLDEKTGKIYRKKTREEVESLIEEPIAQQLPKWMADRGVKNG